MSYTLPTNAGQLLGLGYKMESGLVELGAALGITQITPAKFQTYLTAFSNADNAFNAGRSARQAASDTYQAAVAAMDDWLAVTKSVLVGSFGIRWTTEWAQAGFINYTTQLPRKIEDRIALTGRLAAFFTKNPTYEVPTMKVTAAQAAAEQSTVLAKQLGLTNSTRGLAVLGQAWTDAFNALTNEMWLLIKILQAILGADDPHWLAFGLPMPASPQTPGQPVNVTAQMDDSGNILVQCDAVPLATRYRCRMIIVDVDKDYRLAASGLEPMLSISGVDAGRLVQLIVQAVNGPMQGVASEPLLFRVPVAVAKAAGGAMADETLHVALAEVLPVKRNGNGNGNGAAVYARVV